MNDDSSFALYKCVKIKWRTAASPYKECHWTIFCVSFTHRATAVICSNWQAEMYVTRDSASIAHEFPQCVSTDTLLHIDYRNWFGTIPLFNYSKTTTFTNVVFHAPLCYVLSMQWWCCINWFTFTFPLNFNQTSL